MKLNYIKQQFWWKVWRLWHDCICWPTSYRSGPIRNLHERLVLRVCLWLQDRYHKSFH